MNPPALTKSSNEILSELFGSFNADPPKLKSKKSKKDKHKKSKKSKKSKKKHHSKSRRHKHGTASDSDSSEGPKDDVPVSVLPVFEISLDGTVGVKGNDGKIKPVQARQSPEEDSPVNLLPLLKEDNPLDDVFDDGKKEENGCEKKGKIQIKNLKFSAVFQETVKAVEEKEKEKEKKKAEKAANQEEGEISDSSDSHRSSYSNISESNFSSSKESRSSGRRDLRDHLTGKRSVKRRTSDHRDSKHKKARHHSLEKHRDYRDGYTSRYRDVDQSRISDSQSRSSHREKSNDRLSHTSYSKSKKEGRRSRSIDRKKSKESDSSDSRIDKHKLLAIARKNALKLIDAGVVSTNDKLTSIKAGGRTVNELTEYCKKLAAKEGLSEEISDLSDSSDEAERPFHHPFTVRDRPSSIVMNIKNATPLPVKSLQEKAAEQSKQLRLQFPVSSGNTHRRVEKEWVPVTKEDAPPLPKTKPSSTTTADNTVQKAIMPPPPVSIPFYQLHQVPPLEPMNKPVFPVIQPSPAPLDHASMQTQVAESVNIMQQYQRLSNLELHGIDESSDENVYALAVAAASAVGMDLLETDIALCHRLPQKNKTGPDPIFVQLKSRRVREEWLYKSKECVCTVSQVLGEQTLNGSRRVLVLENLTPYYKHLLWETKQRCRERNYKYSWFSGYKVFAMRDDGYQPIRIVTMSDLEYII